MSALLHTLTYYMWLSYKLPRMLVSWLQTFSHIAPSQRNMSRPRRRLISFATMVFVGSPTQSLWKANVPNGSGCGFDTPTARTTPRQFESACARYTCTIIPNFLLHRLHQQCIQLQLTSVVPILLACVRNVCHCACSCVPTPVLFLLSLPMVVILKYTVPMWVIIVPLEISYGYGFFCKSEPHVNRQKSSTQNRPTQSECETNCFWGLWGCQRQRPLVLR